MKIKVNRNIFWSDLFTEIIANLGIKYACISPGSRNTPLIFSISGKRSIKTFPIVDERTSGFFALGIAKTSLKPVVLATTSGTATAELYPAIIEAFQSRIPLIVCTADRPAYLRNTGSNQTINQKNIFKNHIRFSADLPLPSLNKKSIVNYIRTLIKAFSVAINEQSPVHLNFQFDKPFEPESYTDIIDEKLIQYTLNLVNEIKIDNNLKTNVHPQNFEIPFVDLITIGVGKFSKEFIKLLSRFSSKYNIPVFADVNSGLRFSKAEIPNLIVNYEAMLRRNDFTELFQPKNVLHFGRNLTSQNLENYIVQSKAKRLIVNEFGDRFDSSKKAKIITNTPEDFLEKILGQNFPAFPKEKLFQLKNLDKKFEKLKKETFSETLNEINVLKVLINFLPDNSNLFVGNSLPVRDLDFFSSKISKNIFVYQNRGASGIDGIISTALGVAESSKFPTFLVLGDLSFYYDINSLFLAKHFNVPLKIVVINNKGGRIFDYLPISKYKTTLKKYFQTQVDINIKYICDAFGLKYKSISTLSKYKQSLTDTKNEKSCVILEVKSDALFTKSLKERFWKSLS